MRTEELVSMLATGAGAVAPNQVARRHALALGWGILGAALLMAILLGPRPDLARAVLLPMFWVKLVFVACIAAGSLAAALRLARPGRKLAWVPAAVAAPVLAIWLLSMIVLVPAEAAQREILFFGSTWDVCPFLIATLSVPGFVAAMWAMQGLAPTRLRLAGAAAGLFAGSMGALVYCLHCPEMGAPFIGVWYLLGMLIPAAAGALLGPRLLRW